MVITFFFRARKKDEFAEKIPTFSFFFERLRISFTPIEKRIFFGQFFVEEVEITTVWCCQESGTLLSALSKNRRNLMAFAFLVSALSAWCVLVLVAGVVLF